MVSASSSFRSAFLIDHRTELFWSAMAAALLASIGMLCLFRSGLQPNMAVRLAPAVQDTAALVASDKPSPLGPAAHRSHSSSR